MTFCHDMTNTFNLIPGSGIKADHSEFENRAKNGFSSGDSTDCEGSGRVPTRVGIGLVSASFSFMITSLNVEIIE